jgi:hypothetical protein
MAELLEKGTKVCYKQPCYDGVIIGLKIIDDEVQYLMEFKDEYGAEHAQYYKASQLTVIPEAPAGE